VEQKFSPLFSIDRNVFIVNLAVSDLMLCLITMPLTLVEILYMTWQVSERESVPSALNVSCECHFRLKLYTSFSSK